MGFDASEVMRELDGQRVMQEVDGQRAMREVDARRVLRDSSHVASMSNSLRQYKNIARDLNGIAQLQRSILGSMVPAIGDLRAEKISRTGVYDSLASLSARPLASLRGSHVFPESVRRGLPGLSRNLTSLSNYPRMRSDLLKQARLFGYVDLSTSIAQAFATHALASANITEWSLRSLQSIRTPARRSFPKAATTFGPIVVSPDYEDDQPFNYYPDLGSLLPETATKSGDATEEEELWDVVVAYAQGIAVHYCREVLLSVMGNGRRFVIRVYQHPAAAGAIAGGISAQIGFEIGGAAGATIAGATGPLITYLLTRR